MKIKLPERCFFTVQQLADRWEVSPEEIQHLFDTGQLTKRDKMAVLEGLEGAEYTNFQVHKGPDKDFDLMPPSSPGYCIDGINYGREVKVNIYLDEETALLPPSQQVTYINDFIEYHFPDSRIPVVIIDDVLEFEKQYEIKALAPAGMSVDRGVSEAPTEPGEQFRTAKPYYSIAELATLFSDDYYRVADGLIACGATLVFEGKPADISKWKRPSPPSRGPKGEYKIYVTTGGCSGPIPDPEEVIVSVDAMPTAWVQSIDDIESRNSQDGNGIVALSGNTFERLQRAVADFQNKFKDYQSSPPLMKEIDYWLENAGISLITRERAIFTKMLAEHYKISSDT